MDIRKTVGFQIKQLNLRLSRTANKKIKKEKLTNISEVQQWILSYLFDHQDREIFQTDLQQTFDLKPSTISELLERMQKKGLIELVKVKNDGRKKQIHLTKSSLNKASQINQTIKSLEKNLTDGITPAEISAFYQFVAKLKKNL